MTRDGGGGDNQIHRIDLTRAAARRWSSLGVFQNKLALGTAMTASANGRYILIAQPDGTLMLYDSSVDSFTVSRKETTPLVGAYAASNFDQFVVGNALLNSSLVPIKRFDDTGKSSGFAFLDNQTGIPDRRAHRSPRRVFCSVSIWQSGSRHSSHTYERSANAWRRDARCIHPHTGAARQPKRHRGFDHVGIYGLPVEFRRGHRAAASRPNRQCGRWNSARRARWADFRVWRRSEPGQPVVAADPTADHSR